METFPRKPLLDRIIVREIPIQEYYEQPREGDPGYVPLGADEIGAESFKDRSDRGEVVAVSDKLDDVHVGDTVFFDEFALSDPVFLNPAHKHRKDLPLYWQMRVADLKGVAVTASCEVHWPEFKRSDTTWPEGTKIEITHA